MSARDALFQRRRKHWEKRASALKTLGFWLEPLPPGGAAGLRAICLTTIRC